MARRHRKARKRRGSRTHGWGIQAQHRRHGRLGGRGKAGTHKHKWAPPEPKFAGKVGFKPPRPPYQAANAINIGELDELLDSLRASKKVKRERGKTILSLPELGYNKLLGGGKVTQPFIVKVSAFSEAAARKIREAGGEVVKPD